MTTTRRKTVNVIDRKLHVLVVASGPMRDYRFLHTMLSRHSSIDVDIWLQTVSAATAGQVSQESKRLLLEFPRTAAELFDYDVIIAFDPDWSRIPLDGRKNLLNWVSEHGGGLIVVAGDIYTQQLAQTNDDQLKELQKLYPVYLSASMSDLSLDAKSEQPWPVALTREARGRLLCSSPTIRLIPRAVEGIPGRLPLLSDRGVEAGGDNLRQLRRPPRAKRARAAHFVCSPVLRIGPHHVFGQSRNVATPRRR